MEYINPAAEQILGYPLAALRSADLEFLRRLYADDEWNDVLEVSEGRRFYPVVSRRMRRADGSVFWAEIHNRPIYDESATLTALEGTIRDVSYRKDLLARRGVPRCELECPMEGGIGVNNSYGLTLSERRVLRLVIRGITDKEIAAEMTVAQSTVNKHVSSILGKMGASSRTEAAVRAVSEGLL